MDNIPQAVEYRVAKSSNTLFSVVVLVIMAFLVGLTAYEGRIGRTELQKATECLIEQFADHRIATRSAHQAFSEKLDAPYYVASEDLPSPAEGRLEEACASFIRALPK